MEIRKKQGKAELTLDILGRLETSTAPQLQEVVDNDLSGILHLHIDMKQLEYVSSAGLRVLLEAKNKIKDAGGTMVVTGVNKEVMEVFKITGFDEILDIQ